jgi:hypothetical protein
MRSSAIMINGRRNTITRSRSSNRSVIAMYRPSSFTRKWINSPWSTCPFRERMNSISRSTWLSRGVLNCIYILYRD